MELSSVVPMHNRDYSVEISKLLFSYKPDVEMKLHITEVIIAIWRPKHAQMKCINLWDPCSVCPKYNKDINAGTLNNILQNQQIIFGIAILVKWRFNSIKDRTSRAVRSKSMSSKA